jgi:hypothetical protein
VSFKKNDVGEGKPDWSLFPFDGAEGIVRILMMGAKKYDRDNWRQGLNDPDAQRRIFSATIRHLTALQRGETLDQESGESHVLHAACNLLFLASFSETRKREADASYEEITGYDCDHAHGVCREPEDKCNEPDTHKRDAIGWLYCGDPKCFCAPTQDRTAVEEISGADATPKPKPGIGGTGCDNPTCDICY